LNTDFNSNGADVVATEDESIRRVPTNETTTSNFHSSAQGSIKQQQNYSNYQVAKGKVSSSKSPNPGMRQPTVIQESTPERHVSMLNSVKKGQNAAGQQVL
jgi:hypothetical protein